MNLVEKKNVVLLLAVVVIIISFSLILIQRNLDKPTEYEVEIRDLQSQSTSDEIDVIENDLMDTELDNLDDGLQEIEDELNQSF